MPGVRHRKGRLPAGATGGKLMRLSHTYYNERIELFDGVYDSDRERQLRTLSRLYTRHIGPITQVHLERPDLLDPAMYCGSCNHLPMASVIPDLTVRPSAGDSMSIPGGGKGAGIQQPVLGAMGELAERLFAILHFQAIVDELEVGSWKDMIQRGHRSWTRRVPPVCRRAVSAAGFWIRAVSRGHTVALDPRVVFGDWRTGADPRATRVALLQARGGRDDDRLSDERRAWISHESAARTPARALRIYR